MNMKYFYVDDDTAVLFAGNGTPLAAILVTIPDIVQFVKVPIPTYPLWLYFGGLVFAFLSKSVIQLINSDTRQREKLQAGRDFVVSVRKNSDAPPELLSQMDNLWSLMDEQHGKLLKINHAPKFDKLRALFFFLSATCFLVSTFSLILLSSSIFLLGSSNG